MEKMDDVPAFLSGADSAVAVAVAVVHCPPW